MPFYNDEFENPKGTPLVYDEYRQFQIDSVFKKGQWVFRFPNNYGASVIKHFGSYGYREDLFELAVIFFDGDNWDLTYNTPIASDVIGRLTNDDVLKLLEEIKNL